MTHKNNKHIMIISGEPSGDMRGASLAKAIHQKSPNIYLSGIGGQHMSKAGVTLFADIQDLSVMGFTEIIKKYPTIKKIFNLALKVIKDTQPDAVVLVDYPGFNLRLAKKIKKLGIKVIYYISPQVWAWKEHRVKIIKENVDRLMVLFPFEKEYFRKHQYNVDFVGHPILDEITITENRENFLHNHNITTDKHVIGLLPGSRPNEINNLLPIMLKASEDIHRKNNNYMFLLFKTKQIPDSLYTQIVDQFSLPLSETYDFYNGVNATTCCIVTSGTATLETALLQKPMVVIYKASWLTAFIVRLFLKIPYASLPNIVSQKEIIKEFIQEKAKPENISNEILEILANIGKKTRIEQDLINLKHLLGDGGASQKAANIVLEEID